MKWNGHLKEEIKIDIEEYCVYCRGRRMANLSRAVRNGFGERIAVERHETLRMRVQSPSHYVIWFHDPIEICIS